MGGVLFFNKYAWYAIQYSSKLESQSRNRVIHRKEIDEYIKSELYD